MPGHSNGSKRRYWDFSSVVHSLQSILLDNSDQYRPLLPDLSKVDQIAPYQEEVVQYAAYLDIPYVIFKIDVDDCKEYYSAIIVANDHPVHRVLQEEYGFILEEDSDFIVIKSVSYAIDYYTVLNETFKKIGMLYIAQLGDQFMQEAEDGKN